MPLLDLLVPRSIYIAGPMRGYPEHNFPAFYEAETILRARGWRVVNPARLDGFETPGEKPFAYYMKRDLPLLIDCDCVALLPGWEKSRGAILEVVVAMHFGKTLFQLPTRVNGVMGLVRPELVQRALREEYERIVPRPWTAPTTGVFTVPYEHIVGCDLEIIPDEELEPDWGWDEPWDEVLVEILPDADEAPDWCEPPQPAPENILDEAWDLVHGDRGAAYGHPLDDFSKTARLWSVVFGTDVTPEQVALAMACVKISRELNQHKRDNLVDLAGYAETCQMVVDEKARRSS